MSRFSIRLGNFLYKNAFPVYNLVYPILKNRTDKREIEVIRAYLKPGHTVLDIGANIGFYSQMLSDIVGSSGMVYSFEPDKQNFERLKANCGHLSNVELVNKAVSNETGLLKIYTSPMLNVDHRTYPVDNYDAVLEIESVCGDDFFQSGKKIDFIKIDIQGFEVSAFKGMKRILTENPHLVIVSEYWPYGLNKAGASTADLFSIFWNAGFSIFLIKYNGLEELDRLNYKATDIISESLYMNILIKRK